MTGFEDVNSKFKELMQRAKSVMTERAVTQCLVQAGNYSAALTPMATGTLLNSQYRTTKVTMNGVEGEIGYTAHYAKHVHDAPGKLLGTNTPRYPASDGFVWGPNAEPGFLLKGVREMISNDFNRILQQEYQL